jgi:hypothetical protein
MAWWSDCVYGFDCNLHNVTELFRQDALVISLLIDGITGGIDCNLHNVTELFRQDALVISLLIDGITGG